MLYAYTCWAFVYNFGYLGAQALHAKLVQEDIGPWHTIMAFLWWVFGGFGNAARENHYYIIRSRCEIEVVGKYQILSHDFSKGIASNAMQSAVFARAILETCTSVALSQSVYWIPETKASPFHVHTKMSELHEISHSSPCSCMDY